MWLLRPRIPPNLTSEDTLDLLQRLAPHYSNAVIAGILNRQGRRTRGGARSTANSVSSNVATGKCQSFEAPSSAPEGDIVTVRNAARALGVATSTLHRCLNDGIIVGEQLTPGAPWRIRLTDELRAQFVEEAPPGYVPVVDAMRALGVSWQTVLQRVKRGELDALHVRCGRRKGLRINILS